MSDRTEPNRTDFGLVGSVRNRTGPITAIQMNECVVRPTENNFSGLSASFLDRKLQKTGKITIIFLHNSVGKCYKTLLQFTVNYLIRRMALPNDLFMFAGAGR